MNPSFEHLRSIIANPAGAAQAQASFNTKRLADVQKAYRSRPHFLPLTHTLPAAAAGMPIEESTEPLNHDVVVWGAITDGEDRNVDFYRDIESQAIVRRASGVKLSLDAIAGHSVATAGLPGPNVYAEPFLVPRDKSLAIAMYQETSPGAEETVSTVFCGERIYSQTADEATLPKDVLADVQRWISRRLAPEPRYDVFSIEFDDDGFAIGETPKADEPLLVLGFRSKFTDATVNLGFDGDNSFAKERFPIWALCAEPGNNRTLYQRLRTPLLIPSRQQLLFSFKNTIDGVLFADADPDTVLNIELEMRTV